MDDEAVASTQKREVSTFGLGPGTRLQDRYVIESKLGQGGMGEVWSAYDENVGDRVAVKLLLYAAAGEREEMAQRFDYEARIMAQLRSANVVRIRDRGDIGGRMFIVMDLLEGLSLQEALEERGQLSPRDTLEILRDVAGVLQEAHEKGLVHRDLKPPNIFLEQVSQGTIQVRVLDFGIAKAYDDYLTRPLSGVPKTKTGMFIGTPQYMAPEQFEGETSPSSDLYSLGVVAYECLTGARPFSGSLAQIISRQQTELPAAFDPSLGIPSEVEALVMQLLKKQPSLRPRSAEELRAQIDQVLARGLTARSGREETSEASSPSPAEDPEGASSGAVIGEQGAALDPPGQAEESLERLGAGTSRREVLLGPVTDAAKVPTRSRLLALGAGLVFLSGGFLWWLIGPPSFLFVKAPVRPAPMAPSGLVELPTLLEEEKRAVYEAFEAGRLDEARARIEAALATLPTAPLYSARALVADREGRCADVLGALEKRKAHCAERPPCSEDPRLEAARARCTGALKVRTSPATATVSLRSKDRVLGLEAAEEALRGGGAARLPPGAYTIRAEAPGCRAEEVTVDLSADEDAPRSVELTLSCPKKEDASRSPKRAPTARRSLAIEARGLPEDAAKRLRGRVDEVLAGCEPKRRGSPTGDLDLRLLVYDRGGRVSVSPSSPLAACLARGLERDPVFEAATLNPALVTLRTR